MTSCSCAEMIWLTAHVQQGYEFVLMRSHYYFSVKGAIHSQLNWTILMCDVIPDGKSEYTAQFWQAIAQASEMSFLVVFHTENCAVHLGNPTANDRLIFIHHSHTHKKKHRTNQKKKKLTNLMGNLCCDGEHSIQLFVQVFYTVKLHSLT